VQIVSKNGQARVLNEEQFATLLEVIQENRHPEKNTLIMQISFKLGLREQEIALLRIKEVAEIGNQYSNGFKVKDLLVLPKSFTKGARATRQSKNTQSIRRSVRFSLEEFDQIIKQVVKLAKSGASVDPEEFYPVVQKKSGKTRELPMNDIELSNAISDYLKIRITLNPKLKMNDPLILNQKNRAYSPNSLQDHMALMLKQWANIERASSHSGRRTLATKLIHDQGEHLKTVQQVLGHKDAATTIIYHDVPEEELKQVMKKVGKSYHK